MHIRHIPTFFLSTQNLRLHWPTSAMPLQRSMIGILLVDGSIYPNPNDAKWRSNIWTLLRQERKFWEYFWHITQHRRGLQSWKHYTRWDHLHKAFTLCCWMSEDSMAQVYSVWLSQVKAGTHDCTVYSRPYSQKVTMACILSSGSTVWLSGVIFYLYTWCRKGLAVK